MNGKFLSRNCHNDADTQCIRRKNEPKTFSKFVDKVMGDLPVKVSSRHAVIDPNNPIEVLKDKGLIDISRNKMRTGDGPSDVKVNFYTEESRCGETVKVFSSNHRFKGGKLVYSSTYELLPDVSEEVENRNDWWECRRRRALEAGKGYLRSKSDACCSKSVRKKLTDLFQEVEKQKIIDRFKKEEIKRQRYSRSLSPLNICDTTERESYLHLLSSESKRKPMSLHTVKRSNNISPSRFRYHAEIYKSPAVPSLAEQTYIKSSSELSICSKESRIYCSPNKFVEKASRHEERYKRMVTSPKPKLSKDLFVIPDHTCRKTPRIQHYEQPKHSHWDTIRTALGSSHLRMSSSPVCSSFRHRGHERTSEKHGDKQYDGATRQYEKPHKDYEYQDKKSPTYDPKDRNRRNHVKSSSQRKTSPLKSILSNTHEKSSSKSSQNQKIYFSADTKTGNGKTKYFEGPKNDMHHVTLHPREISRRKHERDSHHECRNYKPGDFKYGKKYAQARGTCKDVESRERYSSSSENDPETESSSQTKEFSPISDSEDEKNLKRHASASDSKTSTCSVYCDCYSKFSSSSQDSFKSSTSQQRQESEESGYATETSRRIRVSKERQGRQQDEFQKKSTKKRREIHPNKVVHVDDSGRRLSQYYTSGKATLDSEKAFEDEDKFRSKKLTLFSHSPKRHGYADRDHGVKIREESLERHLRRTMHEEDKRREDIIQTIVNKEALTEYREKYADYSLQSKKEKMSRTTRENDYDELEFSVDRDYYYYRDHSDKQHGDCEACVIEELLDEEK